MKYSIHSLRIDSWEKNHLPCNFEEKGGNCNKSALKKLLISHDHFVIFPPVFYFSCFDGERLSTSARCNGFPDCALGEDESNCEVGGEEEEVYATVVTEEQVFIYFHIFAACNIASIEWRFFCLNVLLPVV